MKTFWKIILSIFPAAGVMLHIAFSTPKGQFPWYIAIVFILLVVLFYFSVKKFDTVRRSAYRLIGWTSIIFFCLPFTAAISFYLRYLTLSGDQKAFYPLAMIFVGIALFIYGFVPGVVLGIIALILRQNKRKIG